MGGMLRLNTLHRVHRYAGLIAALWLAVLGATGLVLDHREWRWLWQDTIPSAWVPATLAHKADQGQQRLYQVDMAQGNRRLAAGPRGLWISEDGGGSWRPARFSGYRGIPQVLSLQQTGVGSRSQWWAGTDDGLWLASEGGLDFRRVALEGEAVTALADGADVGSVLGVVERSRVFRLDGPDPGRITWLPLKPPAPGTLPPAVSLSRFAYDLHFGRGLAPQPYSLWINDIGAAALFLLPLTGFLYWLLPRYWKARRQGGNPVSAAGKAWTIRALYRLHGPTFGLVALFPLLYLAVTGVLLDHSQAFRGWLQKTPLPRAAQPPVYKLATWTGEIYGIAAYPGHPESLSVGTRLGVFTTQDRGQTWAREVSPGATPGFVWMMRRIGSQLLLGGMGAPNFAKTDGGHWAKAAGSGFMPSDVTRLQGGNLLWMTPAGPREGSMEGMSNSISLALPVLSGVPWYYVVDGLHSGLLIHPQWKWVNDATAGLALVLAVTGTMRWWRRKWL